MSCITKLLELKGDKEFLPVHDEVVIEGGSTYKDYEYLITFTRSGHRCGYVALKTKESDKFIEDAGKDEYYYPNLDCHGGVTFFDENHGAKDLLPIPCNDIWIGFDAAHCDDGKCFNTAKRYFPNQVERISKLEQFYQGFDSFDDITHKSYEYMENECKGIIEQLINSHAQN